MKIEPMTAAHLDGVENIERVCFAHPWSRQSLESELNNENSRFFVAVVDGAVVGYIGMSVVLDEGYIYNLAVLPQCRRRGVGSALVNTLVTYAKRNGFVFLTLEVRKSNSAARKLYEDFGFIKVGERKNYYSSPAEDAVLMTRFLISN